MRLAPYLIPILLWAAPGDGGAPGSAKVTVAPRLSKARAGRPARGAPSCRADFAGPFCADLGGGRKRLLGFGLDTVPARGRPSKAEVRAFSLAAVNFIRSRTCLPPLKASPCLDAWAGKALAAGLNHDYFIRHCKELRAPCPCGLSAENVGLAAGTVYSWKDGIIIPLCAMMEEPKGTGHRRNIESAEYRTLGVGVAFSDTGAEWHHEFGR